MFSITLNAIVMLSIFAIVVIGSTKVALMAKAGNLYTEDDISKDVALNNKRIWQ